MTRSRALHKSWIAGLILTLTWGAAAFGGNYWWAYTPLLVSSAILGAAGLVLNRGGVVPSSVVVGLAVIVVAVGIQLIPLSLSTVAQLSPATTYILSQQDLSVALGVAVATPLSIDPTRTRLGLAFVSALAVLLLGTARGLTRESARTLTHGIVLLGVLLALVGIIQRATFNGKIYGFWELSQGGQPFGPFVNRNHFAGWMLMSLPLAIGAFSSTVSVGMRETKPAFRERLLWFSSPDANKAILIGAAVITMALSVVLTMSRSGIIGLAGALCVSVVVMARRHVTTPRRLVVCGYLVFMAILVVSWVGVDYITARFQAGGIVEPGSRRAIWADTLRVVQDFWLTGTGLNTYGVSMLYYQTSLRGQHLREAHSDYLQLAAEGGVVLAGPILYACGSFVWAVRRRLREDVGSIWWIRMGAVIGLTAIAFQSLGDFSLQMPGNASLFVVLAGIALHDST